MSKKPWKSKSKSDVFEKYSTGVIYYDNEKELVGAAIKEACREFKSAYIRKDKHSMEALTIWFRSPIFDLWVNGDISPDSLIRGIKRQVDNDENRMYSQIRVRE